jgi:hypothetical protein
MNGMSGKAKARLAGVLYVINVAGAIAAQGVISQRFIHLSDPAGTASRIAANPGLYGLGFSLYMVEMIAQIGVALVFYELLKPVSRPLSRASLVFGLAGCVIKTFARAFYYAPLAFVGSPQAESATAV